LRTHDNFGQFYILKRTTLFVLSRILTVSTWFVSICDFNLRCGFYYQSTLLNLYGSQMLPFG